MQIDSSQPSWLRSVFFVVYAASAAFFTYFCMYAFRKTFSVASFAGAPSWLQIVDFKTSIVLAQVLGYALSKFIGIKLVSEMSHDRRALAILVLVMLSELALILFAVVPSTLKPLTLFLNGLPLGMIWGLVFSFLEGRRVTEILGAGLSISFIVSSGMVKSVGKWLMVAQGVSEYWMPALTGGIFTVPLFISVYFLSKIPAPTEKDHRERHIRLPMTQADRKAFFVKFFTGLVPLIACYVLLTALRDFSDNFAAEIWDALGFADQPAIFSKAALISTLIVLALLSTMVVVKSNLRALLFNHLFIFFGVLLVGLSTLFFQNDILSAEAWMVLHSTGIYLAYIPFNCILFDRLLALVKNKANAGFLIYIADAMGYFGSVGILLYKNFFSVELSWLSFLLKTSYITSVLGAGLVCFSMWYFNKKFGLVGAGVAEPSLKL